MPTDILKLEALRNPPTPQEEPSPAYRAGFWSSLVATALGLIFVVLTVWSGYVDTTSKGIQLAAGLTALIFAPALVVLMSCLLAVTPNSRKVFSTAALTFTTIFALVVSLSRFLHLTVTLESRDMLISPGGLNGWFLPYNQGSILFNLEVIGWGWFLGLALAFGSLIFPREGTLAGLRFLMLVYAASGVASAASQLLRMNLAILGFIVWTFLLPVITALMTLYFRSLSRSAPAG